MRVVFLSNYFNHHQQPYSEAMDKLLGGEYAFIETERMPEFREKLGYQRLELPSYVIPFEYAANFFPETVKIINEADVVLLGDAPHKYIAERKKQKKLIISCSERIFKKQVNLLRYFSRRFKVRKRLKGKNIYLLCNGSYVSKDYAKLGLFKKKAFKWGYFPETKHYENIDDLISKKERNSIFWAGRFIDWKHAESCVELAKRLKDSGYEFKIKMAGIGKRRIVRDLAQTYGVLDNIEFLGSLSPDEVRQKMEASEIFLLTSGTEEGWGAVLNEAMNSGCASVASCQAGSTGYLIKNGENGLTFNFDDMDELYCKVKSLLDDSSKTKQIAKNAYITITEEWNAQNAAARLVKLVDGIMNEQDLDIFTSGPCSRA